MEFMERAVKYMVFQPKLMEGQRAEWKRQFEGQFQQNWVVIFYKNSP